MRNNDKCVRYFSKGPVSMRDLKRFCRVLSGLLEEFDEFSEKAGDELNIQINKGVDWSVDTETFTDLQKQEQNLYEAAIRITA